MAFEMREQARSKDRITVISDTPTFHFMPSNPWVAVNWRARLDGKEPVEKATWNAVWRADFGDTGIAFAALPQIPPRNVNWVSEGKWVHLAKIAFEKYFMHKMKKGTSDPFYENLVLKPIGIKKLKDKA